MQLTSAFFLPPKYCRANLGRFDLLTKVCLIQYQELRTMKITNSVPVYTVKPPYLELDGTG